MRMTGAVAAAAGVFASAVLLAGATVAAVADDFESARQALVREIERDVRDTAEYLSRRELDARVMAAMAVVPRHEFVRPGDRDLAYANRPLPIGSRPDDLAAVHRRGHDRPDRARPRLRALEVGTGSGYQAAVLSLLCEEVYTIEIVEPLGLQARERLARLGYRNVRVRIGDGYYGWPEAAPFDVIVVTAVAGHVPPPLLKQLKPGGRMVLPVGTRFTTQQLVLVHKLADGKVRTRQMLPVSFVPLTGGHD